MKITSRNTTSDACFLRPYLTREEYLYWSSHYSYMPPSCACPNCTNVRDTTTTMIHQHKEPPVSARNVTGMPTRGRPRSAIPASHRNGLGECFYGQTECAPTRFLPEKPAFTNVQRKLTASSLDCRPPINPVYKRSAGEYTFRNKEVVKNPLSSECNVPLASRMGNDNTKKSLKCNSTGRKRINQEITSKISRLSKISKQYLCGDKSFDEMPQTMPSTTRGGITRKPRSPVLCDSTSAYVPQPEIDSTDSFPVKRKSTSDSELDHYPPKKFQRNILDNGVNGIHEPQTSVETIDLNDSWRKYLEGSLTTSGYGSKTLAEDQPMEKKQADGTTDSTAMSRVIQKGDQTPNYGNKSLERIDGVFRTSKPVQRKLPKDSGNIVSGGYALDYDSLPKIGGVLPSKVATVISGSANRAISLKLKP